MAIRSWTFVCAAVFLAGCTSTFQAASNSSVLSSSSLSSQGSNPGKGTNIGASVDPSFISPLVSGSSSASSPSMVVTPAASAVASPATPPSVASLAESAAYGAGGFLLVPNQSVAIGDLTMLFQSDGNLVLYQGGRVLWATSFFSQNSIPVGRGTGGMSCAACAATLQADGNFVLYNAGIPYWSSATSGHAGASLRITATAPYVTIVDASGSLLWSALSAVQGFSLAAGQGIVMGNQLLTMQTDGNLVLYQDGAVVWASSEFPNDGIPAGLITSGLSCSACAAVLQSDGNLVLYNGGVPYWNTTSNTYPNAVLSFSASAPFLSIQSGAPNAGSNAMVWVAGQSSSPSAALVVDQTSSIVVMEYEAWFTPQHPLAEIPHSYNPLLSSPSTVPVGQPGYSSEDPGVIAQHLAWLQGMGVNAVTAEQTNGGPCNLSYSNISLCQAYLTRMGIPTGTQGTYTAMIDSIDNATLNLYPAFAASGTNIKLIPVLDGQDPEMYVPFQGANGAPTTALQNQLASYIAYATQYPQEVVYYQGKPLLVLYLGAQQQPGVAGSVLTLAQAFAAEFQNQFSLQVMATEIDSQPALWNPGPGLANLHQVNRAYQLWTWFDRFNVPAGLIPSYTASPTSSRVEAFTISPATPGTGGWASADTAIYDGGILMNQFVQYAQALHPMFLFVSQFNEYASPDQGVDENHSADMEPNQQWGFDRYNFARAEILSYKTVSGRN